MELRRDLTLFDLTNIVIGSIVGADIYIASALTAGLVGPFAIVVWALAAICATVLALVFAYCSYYLPLVGGPFAYVSEAFDDFYGFIAGWSLWIAEILALPVFAIAFTQYLEYFIPLSPLQEILVKGAFITALTLVNVVGVKAAGRVNDLLTMLKLLPLFAIVAGGLAVFVLDPARFIANYTPLAPLGFGHVGAALVLIFWAYAGFELGTLPASEVKDPKNNIPKAIIRGMAVVTLFYLSTNFVVFGMVPWQVLAGSKTPLVLVGAALFGAAGAAFMTVGALVSVSGSDESGILGTARLSYAMAIDGLFPKVFARIHPGYETPYAALVIEGVIAFLLSLISGIPGLISFAVFNLAFSFLLTCLALTIISRGKTDRLPGQEVLPWVGVVICLYLLWSTSLFDKITGTLVILAGIPIYVYFSPKADIYHLKELFTSEEAIFVRRMARQRRFLANLLRIIHNIVG
ncbi:MAG TPA: APC family permease [Methanomicrobiales archaeon]|jgi:amino acid transporter|nr:APC family permease [Methanomicrobiales archaeon]